MKKPTIIIYSLILVILSIYTFWCLVIYNISQFIYIQNNPHRAKQENLARELGVEIDDYPGAITFPSGYFYGSNNPSRFIDPTGHRDVDTGLGAYGELSWIDKLLLRPKDDVIKFCASLFHIQLYKFSTNQMWQAYVAALLVGDAFAQATETADSAWSAFNAVYGTVKLSMGNCDNCPSPTGGRTYPYNGSYWDIRFNGLMKGMAGVHNIIHEFGHAFDGTFYSREYRNEFQPSTLAWDFKGFPQDSSGFIERFGLNDGPSELFADMFLGWVTGKFASNSAGAARSTWMTTNMVEFLH